MTGHGASGSGKKLGTGDRRVIQPIRPLGWIDLAVRNVVFDIRVRLACIFGRHDRFCQQSQLLWRAYDPSGAQQPALPRAFDALDRPRWCENGRRWEPWPASPIFADEVTRWWPSDEFPPPEPAVVIENRLPDAPPVYLDPSVRGRFIDFWA